MTTTAPQESPSSHEKPDGATSFEDAAAKFRGVKLNPPDGTLTWWAAVVVASAVTAVAVLLAVALDPWFILWSFAAVILWGLVPLAGAIGTIIGETEWGPVRSSTTTVIYTPVPVVSNNRVEWIKHTFPTGRVRKRVTAAISNHPEAWARYVYYQLMADTTRKVTTGLPRTPRPLAERALWYQEQADTYFTQLFTPPQDNAMGDREAGGADDKPAGVVDFDAAARSFTGEPVDLLARGWGWWVLLALAVATTAAVVWICFMWEPWLLFFLAGVPAMLWALVFPVGFPAQRVVGTEYGGVMSVLDTVYTPIPWSAPDGVRVVRARYASEVANKVMVEAAQGAPEVWVRYVYYWHQANILTRDLKDLGGEPAVLSEQRQWYQQQADYYYDHLFSTYTPTSMGVAPVTGGNTGAGDTVDGGRVCWSFRFEIFCVIMRVLLDSMGSTARK